MPRVSGLWRLDAFLETHPPLPSTTRRRLVEWVIGLTEESVPRDVVECSDEVHGTVYRVIVAGTDVEVTYRLLASGSARLLLFRRMS